MAIRDEFSTFGKNVDINSEPATIIFPNSIDLGVTGRDPGNGKPVYVNFAVTEAFTDGGDSATATFKVISDSTADLATSATVHLVTPGYLKAALALGNTFSFQLPEGVSVNTYERYLGVEVVVGTAGFDAGMITAWLSPDPVQGWKAYADAVN